MENKKFIIKATLYGLSFQQWKTDMSIFVSTIIMATENWSDVTFDFSGQFKLPYGTEAKKRLGETRQAITALENDIHTLSNCWQMFLKFQADPEMSNIQRTLNYATLSEKYFSTVRSIYDHLAIFPRITYPKQVLESRAKCPKSMNDLIKKCKNKTTDSTFINQNIAFAILNMEDNLSNIKMIRDSIVHHGKSPIVSFEDKYVPLITLPKNTGMFRSPNILPDLLGLGDGSYPLVDYLRQVTLNLLDDMELLGREIFDVYSQQVDSQRKFILFGLTGFDMEDFHRFLFPSGEKTHITHHIKH